MAKKNESKSCEADPKDPNPSHECVHGQSVPNRPTPLAEEYKRRNGHY